MTFNIRSFAAAAWLCAAATASPAQQSGPHPQQPPSQRDDPSTSGAGPTSRSSGETRYQAPKGAAVTTDDKGVTTRNSAGQGAKTNDAPLDQGNDSFDAIAPDKK
jgi:hypothetical protein